MQEALVHSWVRKICWRKDTLPTAICFGFLCGLAGKESACSVGDLDSIPGLGRYPGEGNAYPSQQPKEAPRGGKPAPSRQVHLFFPYCCHATLSVKPQAQPRHTESTREKHNVSQGASSPAQPSPAHPPPPVLRHDRTLSLPSLAGDPALSCPDAPSSTARRHLSSQRGPHGVRSQHCPGQVQLPDPSVCPLASLPVHTLWVPVVPSDPHVVAPSRAVSAHQAEGSHSRDGW